VVNAVGLVGRKGSNSKQQQQASGRRGVASPPGEPARGSGRARRVPLFAFFAQLPPWPMRCAPRWRPVGWETGSGAANTYVPPKLAD
jgi:hypothetical protein